MKRFVRLLALVAVAGMLSGAFIGCGDKKENGGGKAEADLDLDGRVIKFASYYDNAPKAGKSEGEDFALEKIAKLEKKYNCKIEYVVIPMDQYKETIVSSTLAGAPAADVFEMHVMWFYPGLVTKNYLTNLSELGVFDFTEEKWNQTILKHGTYKGSIYGVGLGNMGPQNGVFWNKTLFKRDGLPDLHDLWEKGQWTWEKFREIAIKATRATKGDGDINQWGLDGGPDSFVASNNAFIVTVDDEGMPSFGLTNPNAIEALQFYSDLKTKDKVFFTAPEGSAWDYGLNRFAEGGTAMYLSQHWVSFTLKETMKDDYGFVYFPKGPKATEYTSSLSGFNLSGMSSAVKNPKDVARIWNEYTIPSEDDGPDSYIDYYEQQAPDAGTAKVIIDMIKNKRYTLNMVESFPELLTLCGSLYGHISQGNMTAQEGVDTIRPNAESILKQAMEDIKK